MSSLMFGNSGFKDNSKVKDSVSLRSNVESVVAIAVALRTQI
ncbi:hypothetical protein PC116_g820 [Phytophthora cactorum]|uniref:Uncharacterized protein n=1 Tax=Phytophthora cactorum TaxID=29920 RepID=A0A8T1EEV3_9STRA|nr:hypothetical protein PC114_g4931 [Phytophthora cactorum]KAG2949886.1 hypothetical protein PC117_g4916 [Phytophthora cactorum]KAG4251508.1 hypothetical protein PC116_g820 [Phytophthora cactorum]